MTIQDWSNELDHYLLTIEEDVLPEGETLSLQIATDYAISEFQKYREVRDCAYHSDFELMGSGYFFHFYSKRLVIRAINDYIYTAYFINN